MNNKIITSNTVIVWILAILFLLAIGSNFYHYYYTKNYDYIVETSCDPETEKCFSRDCEAGDCPPNNLAFYKNYVVKAYDFPKCTTNSCKIRCETGEIECLEISCEETDECFVGGEAPDPEEENIVETTE